MIGVNWAAPQNPAVLLVGKFAARNSPAISAGSASVPSSRPAPSAAPSVEAAENGHVSRFLHLIVQRNRPRRGVEGHTRGTAHQRAAEIAAMNARLANHQPLREHPLPQIGAANRVPVNIHSQSIRQTHGLVDIRDRISDKHMALSIYVTVLRITTALPDPEVALKLTPEPIDASIVLLPAWEKSTPRAYMCPASRPS